MSTTQFVLHFALEMLLSKPGGNWRVISFQWVTHETAISYLQGVLYIVNQNKIAWCLCYLFALGGMGPWFMFWSFEELCHALLKALDRYVKEKQLKKHMLLPELLHISE